MKKQEMHRILREETERIWPDKRKRWQSVFRRLYNKIRRHDLDEAPATRRRDSFLKSLADIRQAYPEFNPIDLDYDTSFFGPLPIDNTKPLGIQDTKRMLAIVERQKVLHRWEEFAIRNNLELATWNPLGFRAQAVVDNKGACPCHPKKRPSCPCKECIAEVEREGACSCVVFVNSKRYKEVRGSK